MKKMIVSIYVAILIMAGCSFSNTIYLPLYSAKISFYNHTAEYYPDGKIKKCKLSDVATINQYRCISWIWFFENGQIKQFKTAENIKMNDFTIPPRSTIFFYDQSPGKIKYIWFSEDVVIKHLTCKGGGKISTEFYDNDSLKACFLSRDQNIQGFPCKSSLFNPVYFYPDGKIKIVTLSKDSTFGDINYKKGESILIGENGQVSNFKR